MRRTCHLTAGGGEALHTSRLRQARHGRHSSGPCPAPSPVAAAREREAVDSEYRLKLKDDARRFREVRRKTVNPEHGFAKFSVGDRDTLADRPGRPVWSDLKAFYDAHYTADRMSLAVVGRESVDTLERWVRERASTGVCIGGAEHG